MDRMAEQLHFIFADGVAECDELSAKYATCFVVLFDLRVTSNVCLVDR